MAIAKSIFIKGTIAVEGPNTALISGSVSDPSHVASVEIFDGTNDLGPATLSADGT